MEGVELSPKIKREAPRHQGFVIFNRLPVTGIQVRGVKPGSQGMVDQFWGAWFPWRKERPPHRVMVWGPISH